MWLLEQSILELMKQSSSLMPNVEQQTEYEARILAESESGSRILSVAGNNAQISVNGVLTNRPSYFARIFGGGNTSYPEIVSAFAEAQADNTITHITMAVDSPGGMVSGLFDTLAAIENITKPITAVVSNMAASAAYAIVSKADKIIAKNRASSFGSVGIVANYYVYDDEVTITSDKAPKKRPDVKTKEGVKVVKEELNVLHQLFVESIAAGRKTSVDKINSDFGKGAVLYADDALKAGMIDDIQGNKLVVVNPTTAERGKTEKGVLMDLSKLKAEHPEVHAEVVLIGEKNGIAKERDRVSSFVVAGEQSGDMKRALECIKDGSEMTMTIQTEFMMAAANRKDISTRDEDENNAGDNVDASDAADDSDKVLAQVKEKLGYKEAV